ncbi:MAG: hypothetical protein LJE64_13360 [Desulfofustis sp.]|jgi:hypothetical protein|nr:hypothetical protein [Desulfofustis sp.]
MNSWNLKTYLTYALLIVRTSTIVLWWIGFVALLSVVALSLKGTAAFWPLNILVTLLSIASTPVIYGIYFELIEDTYSSIPRIFKTYVPGYIWLIIRMYLPPIFVASLLLSLLAGTIPNFTGSGFLEITLVLFSLIYLFVIPTFYLTGSGRGSIGTGVAFLLANLSRTTPILLTVILLETGMLLLQYQRSGFTPGENPAYLVIDFLVFVIASIIDYVVFIMLIFILKDQQP